MSSADPSGPRAAAGPGGSRPAIKQAGESRSARLESIRALAALAVVVAHVEFAVLAVNTLGASLSLDIGQKLLYGAGFSVWVFFGLSGYLLYWPFARRDFGGGAGIDLKRYAVNRVLRVVPLYFAVVVIILAFRHDIAAGIWGRFLTLTENFSDTTAGNVIGPAWSLVVEIHFYIFIPFLAWALGRLGSARRALAVLLGIAVASLALRQHFVYSPAIPRAVWRYNVPTTFLFFIPGMVLAIIRARWESLGPPAWLRGALRNSNLWLVATLPFWAFVVLGHYDSDWLIALATFLLLGACVLPLRGGLLIRGLEWRPLAALGVATYSLYLWHTTVIDLLISKFDVPALTLPLIAASVPASIAVGVLSYRVIERPFLSLRRQWSSASAPKPEPEPAQREAAASSG